MPFNFKLRHISYYLTKQNLIALIVALLIILSGLGSYFLSQKLFKNKYREDHYKDCLRTHMSETQRLKETLCQSRGYEKDCKVENLAEEDIEVFVTYFERGNQKCRDMYP